MHCFNLHKQQNALHNISITHSHDTMELPCKASARPSGATGVLCLPQGRLRTCTGGGGRAKTANPGIDGAARPSEPRPA